MSILDEKKLNVINLGLPLFEESLQKQDVEVVQVNWKPAAGGDQKLLEVIDKLLEADIHA